MGLDFDTCRAMLPELIKRAPRGAAYPELVFATFHLALRRAIEQTPEAERLLGIAAFLAPDRIPLDIIADDVMTPIERGEAVAALVEVSLAALEPLDDGTPGLTIHPLVQAVMRERVGTSSPQDATASRGEGGDEGQQLAPSQAAAPHPDPGSSPGQAPLPAMGGERELVALATRLVAAAFPHGEDDPADARTWDRCRRLEEHARAVLAFAVEDGEDAEVTAVLSSLLAQYLDARADYANAEPLMRRALAVNERRVDPSTPPSPSALSNLGSLLAETARAGEAEPLLRRALEVDERVHGPDHPGTARSLNNLARLLHDTDRLDEAEALLRRGLAISEKSLDPGHPTIAIELNNLAGILRSTGRGGEAEALLRRALAIDERHHGPDHPNTAMRLGNLALLLTEDGRLEEAEPLLRRALAIDEASHAPDHPARWLLLSATSPDCCRRRAATRRRCRWRGGHLR